MDSTIKCPYCNKNFVRKFTLNRHIKQYHSEMSEYESDNQSDVTEAESEASTENGSQNGDENGEEHQISQKTIQQLESLVTAAEIGIITLNKKQIREFIDMKEGFESDENTVESNDENETNESETDEEEDLSHESLKLLRSLLEAAYNGHFYLTVEGMDNILSNITTPE